MLPWLQLVCCELQTLQRSTIQRWLSRAAGSMPVSTFESGHGDMVHDCQLDYYGRRLATCSSDCSIKIFDVAGDQHMHLADLKGHEGPVWQLAWVHPKFGSILASCSFDHRIIIWKEVSENNWTQLHATKTSLHTASVNSVSAAPHELGLHIVAGSSDGSISVTSYQPDGTWNTAKLDNAHPMGCNAVSWAPATPVAAAAAGAQPAYTRHFASAGCDNTVKVWMYGDHGWEQEQVLQGHTDWVRDVAWSPAQGVPFQAVASAGQDGLVLVWTNRGKGWEKVLVHNFQAPVWRVSWSVTGNILAVSDNNNTTLWKETVDGTWTQLQE